jgi:hypothetical protein
MLVLIGVIGAIVWLAVLGFFLALCRASGIADEQAVARVKRARAPRSPIARSGAQVLDLGMWRTARGDRLVRGDDRLVRAR